MRRISTRFHHRGAIAMSVAAVAVTVLTPIALPPGVAAASTPNCGPPVDTVPPALSNLTLSSTSIDITTKAVPVKISVNATDTSASTVASGVADILVIIAGPGRSQNFGYITDLRLASGSTSSGVWKGGAEFAPGTPAGVYNVVEVDAVDADGNVQTYSEGGGSFFSVLTSSMVVSPGARSAMSRFSRLESAVTTPSRPAGSPTDPELQPNWDTQLTVTSATTGGGGGSGGGGPTPPPTPTPGNGKLTKFVLNPSPVNSTKGPATLHATATMSGAHPTVLEALLDNVDKSPTPQDEILMRRHGSAYKGSLRVPQWNDSGTYHVTLAALTDNSEGRLVHVQAFAADQLAARGFTHEVTFITGADHTKPTLSSLSISPDPIDSTGGRQTVTATAHASDVGSGVSKVVVSIYQVVSEYGFQFPMVLKNIRLVKTGKNYIGSASVGPCVASGNYKVAAEVVDAAGNAKGYGPAALSALSAPSKIEVTGAGGDLTPPTITGAAAGEHSIGIDFSEGVKNVTASTLSVYALSPAKTRYQSTEPISSISCFDSSDDPTDCSGSTDPVAYAYVTVPSLTAGTDYEVWANLNSVTTQLTDVAGNPLTWLYAAAEVQYP